MQIYTSASFVNDEVPEHHESNDLATHQGGRKVLKHINTAVLQETCVIQ